MGRREVPAQIVQPLRVGDRTVGCHGVVECCAVLGDHQRLARELVVQRYEEFLESFGRDVPPHSRVRAGLLHELHDLVAARPRRAALGALVTIVLLFRRDPVPHPHRRGRVVVHAQHVDRLMDVGKIPVTDERPVGHRCRVLQQVGRVLPPQHRPRERAVRERIDAAHRLRCTITLTAQHVEVQRHRVLRVPGRCRPQRLHRPAVRKIQVVDRRERSSRLMPARRVTALAVPEVRGAPRLVQRRPGVDPVTERGAHNPRVLLERIHGRAVRPTAGILQRLRQIPVIQRRYRLDASREQTVDESRVEVEPRLVHRAAARWHDAGPRDREPIGVQTQLRHEVEIALPAVVVVARHIPRVTVPHLAGRLAEPVPDRGSTPVLVERALHLIRRGRRTEREVLRKDEAGITVIRRTGHCSLTLDHSFSVTAARSTSKVSTRPSGVVTVTLAIPAPPGKTRSASSSR